LVWKQKAWVVSVGEPNVVGLDQRFEEVVRGPGKVPETAQGLWGFDSLRGGQFLRTCDQWVSSGGRVGVDGHADEMAKCALEALGEDVDQVGWRRVLFQDLVEVVEDGIGHAGISSPECGERS
jgi:uncharacterized protein CbrC (UPF0167 family)